MSRAAGAFGRHAHPTAHMAARLAFVVFHSILFDQADRASVLNVWDTGEVFSDLNLDQVVDGIISGREEYQLKAFFLEPLRAVSTIEYRHEVMRDLEDQSLLDGVRSFSERMRTVLRRVARKDPAHRYQKLRWDLEAAVGYCEAVTGLTEDLACSDLRSDGFLGLRDYMVALAGSDSFRTLLNDTRLLISDLAGVRYNLRIRGNRIRVMPYRDEVDYGAEVELAFSKFQQGAIKNREFRFPMAYMTHVDAAVLDRIGRLYPEVFRSLEQFGERHRDFLDQTIRTFSREVQFYIAYIDFIEPLRSGGLPFCYPLVDESKDVNVSGAYDLALAKKLSTGAGAVVCNDFSLHDGERILVVTGPNQGGKTTFARMVGQLHYLASLGLPVPGKSAQLLLCDRLFTHFDRQERLENLTGKLEEDLLRIHAILEAATGRSIVILNESLSSTTVDDALVLSRRVITDVIERDALCVCVTFLDELSRLGQSTVSMVGTVDPDDPARRTYEIVRRPADGLAYALAIAEKYGVTYEGVMRRVAG